MNQESMAKCQKLWIVYRMLCMHFSLRWSKGFMRTSGEYVSIARVTPCFFLCVQFLWLNIMKTHPHCKIYQWSTHFSDTWSWSSKCMAARGIVFRWGRKFLALPPVLCKQCLMGDDQPVHCENKEDQQKMWLYSTLLSPSATLNFFLVGNGSSWL